MAPDWFKKNYTSAAIPQHIYRYDLFYLMVADSSNISLMNVYFTIRAINILKYKFPEAYLKLVQQTLYFPYKAYMNSIVNNKLKNIGFLNSNKFFFIIYNEFPTGVASSFTAFNDKSSPWVKDNKVQVSQNYPILSVHKSKLLGLDKLTGSRAIYGFPEPALNYQHYMRDGLIETISHEFIHRYIDVFYSVDKFTNELFTSPGRVNNDADFGSLEEAIVRYTAVNYFSKHPGLSNQIIYFEDAEADLNCIDLVKNGKLYDFLKKVNDWKGVAETDVFKAFQIPIFDDVR